MKLYRPGLWDEISRSIKEDKGFADYKVDVNDYVKIEEIEPNC